MVEEICDDIFNKGLITKVCRTQYKKNPNNPISKWERFEQTFLQKKTYIGQKTYEEMFNISNYMEMQIKSQ